MMFNASFKIIALDTFMFLGLHFRRKCPKGSSCNFLHVFKNPGNLFGKIEKNVYKTPLRSDAADKYVCTRKSKMNLVN